VKWEYFGTGLAFVGIGVTLVLALPPPWWPKMPPLLTHAGIIVGIILTVAGVALAVFGAWAVIPPPKVSFIATAVFGIAFLVALSIWYLGQDNTEHRTLPIDESHKGEGEGLPTKQEQEIDTLANFIDGDEMALRNKFDLQTILSENIRINTIRIGLRSAGRLESFVWSNFAQGDGFTMLAREGKYHMTPSGPHIDAGPKDILYLITTKKHQDAMKYLNVVIDSMTIPNSIKTAVLALRDAVGKNIEIMNTILDDRANESDDFILSYDVAGSPYYRVISNDFVSRMAQLKPVADGVRNAIRHHLGIN
jgi:hypothetical protein